MGCVVVLMVDRRGWRAFRPVSPCPYFESNGHVYGRDGGGLVPWLVGMRGYFFFLLFFVCKRANVREFKLAEGAGRRCDCLPLPKPRGGNDGVVACLVGVEL